MKPDRSSRIPSHEWHFASEAEIYNRLLDEQQDNPLLSPQKWLVSLDGRRADAGRSGEFSFSCDSKLLSCQAFLIGVVDGIAPEWTAGSEKSVEEWSQEARQPHNEQSPYGDEGQTQRALLRTLFFDPLDDSKQASSIFEISGLSSEAEKVTGTASIKGESGGEPVQNTNDQEWDPQTSAGSFPRFESLRNCIGSFRLGGKAFKE